MLRFSIFVASAITFTNGLHMRARGDQAGYDEPWILVKSPVPSDIVAKPYNTTADICTVVNADNSTLFTFKTKEKDTLLVDLHCFGRTYSFSNGLAHKIKRNGKVTEFASARQDLLGHLGGYGSGSDDELVCVTGVMNIFGQIPKVDESSTKDRFCSYATIPFNGIPLPNVGYHDAIKNITMPVTGRDTTTPYSEYSGRCVAYSFMAMLCFGITNYLIALATGILDNSVETYFAIGAEWKMLAIIWGVGGIPGILCYLIHWLRVGKIELFWSHNPTDTPNITWGTKALTLIGGLGLGVSMSLMKKAFVFTSPADKGPVSAVLCSTIIVVSVYGHFVFRELLSKRHALLIGIVVCGIVISALGPGGSTKAEDQAAATGQEYHETLGFLFAILSMLAFASTTLLVRYSAIGKVSTWSAFSARLLSQTGMAILVGYTFVKSDEGEELPPLVLPGEVVTLAVLAGITQVAGFFALNLALSYPYTSLVNVVVSANSIVVLGLNFAIDGLLPCPSQLIGMLVILFGVTLSSLAPPVPNHEQATTDDKKYPKSFECDNAREPLLRRFSI